jgi:signal transduction histidine kinase
MHSRIGSRIIVIVAASLAFAVVALHGVLEYRATRGIISQFAEARQDSDTIIALDQVLDDVVNAETGQRGFVITGERQYLEPYRTSLRQIDAHLRTLDRLTAAEPAQQQRLRVLRGAIEAKFAELSQTIRAYDEHGRGVAMAMIAGGRGRELMATIRGTMADMIAVEEQERVAARSSADRAAAGVLNGIIVSTSVAAILLLLTFVQFGIAARVSERARQESESANRLKDQFLATISHELRTPLTAILGWSEVLRDREIGRETLEDGLATIERSASVQKKLIEDLLDLARVQTGKLRLSMRTLDLAGAVTAAVDSMRPAAGAKSIAVVTHAERGIGVSGDPDRLQQIVWNLMTNAVKFTPRGGQIEVSVARAGAEAIIEVRDTGEGIDAAFLPHVFEPFRQSDASRALVHKGLGLGLSIVKHLVEAHGGEVFVHSAGRGQGTTFRIALPVVCELLAASA